MPTTVNGIGTWYYGKRRIHRFKDVCSFCNALGELESYDTTLYFVVLKIPLLPLGRKRVLEACPSCQQHRVIDLKKWEAIKAQDIARLLEQLQLQPNDSEAIRAALALAVAYQDEKLFDQLAAALAEPRKDDAAIQAQLGAGYAYFVRWPEAETAFRASLEVQDDLIVQRRLALALLKQLRPEEAHPYLLPILDQRLEDEAGTIYALVEAYQAQGMHREALQVMDQRDAAFPGLAGLKEYRTQRQTSERHLSTGKKVRPAVLGESSRAGYREGGWTARVPRLIAPLLVLALIALYLGSALWIGQARKVFFVNGLDRAYAVSVNGREQTLPPGATEIRVPEGEVVVESRDAAAPFEPVRCRVETSFFSRPFVSRTFAINPDRLAILMWERAEYSDIPLAGGEPPQFHVGETLYSFDGLDYEFTKFPPTVQAKKGQTIRKTRVALVPDLQLETRLGLMTNILGERQQIDYARRWLHLHPHDIFFLTWVTTRLKEAEALEFLRPGLATRPVLVEWHRAYQDLVEKADPKQDLRAEYQRLVTETNGHADALYLQGRVQDTEKADRLFRQAAGATPPSAYAVHALGYDALSRGQFADALTWAEKALKLAPQNPLMRQTLRSVLQAAGAHDRLLGELRAQPASVTTLLEQARVHAARGDRDAAWAMVLQALMRLPPETDAGTRRGYQTGAEMMLCCASGDVPGFLKLAAVAPEGVRFEAALLQGKLREAANAVAEGVDGRVGEQRGLLYLAALKAGNKEVADEQWLLLLTFLAKARRHERRLGEMLAGRQPLDTGVIRLLPIDPREKRVLLVVVVRRHPDQAMDLLGLARTLDYHGDETSLCLRRFRD